MKITKKNIKKIIFPSIIVIFIFIAIFLSVSKKQYNELNEIYNSNIEQIIGKIKETYPDLYEKDIIEILQNKDYKEEGQKFFEKYGYTEDMQYIESLNQKIQVNVIINVVIIIVFGICIIYVCLKYVSNQNEQIEEINLYLKKVNNGNYKLKIEENSEDELSKLRNELYKTTILLRETAENSKKESENLSKALEDISHQLKTPITSIRIMIDNIFENPDMNEETREDFLKTISKQVDWISSLVISLLKLAKLDSGTIIMNDDTISAEKLINDAIENLSIILDIKNIKIEKDIPNNSDFIADYKWQLEAITNIIKNSIEHSNENSKIDIKVENSSVMLKIIIKDYGEGISKKDINHIFQRFYKTKNASSDSVGIGLALAKTIIEKDNGYISVTSKEGKGTTFTIKYMNKRTKIS